MANRQRVTALYDERFCPMWEFYLVLCEIGFRFRSMMVFQIQFARRPDVVPFTRDDMTNWEQAHTPASSRIRAAE